MPGWLSVFGTPRNNRGTRHHHGLPTFAAAGHFAVKSVRRGKGITTLWATKADHGLHPRTKGVTRVEYNSQSAISIKRREAFSQSSALTLTRVFKLSRGHLSATQNLVSCSFVRL
jgi:hypothetical protein